MKKTPKTVLLTGASGFIGANMARFLVQKKYAVHIVVRRTSNLWRLYDIKASLHIHYGDLTDAGWIQKKVASIRPAYIFNFAQYGGYPQEKDGKKTWDTNLLGAVNLLHAAQKAGCKRFVQIGSSSEYGKKNKPMRETDLPEPNGPYGVSKAAATLYSQYLSRESKLPVVVLRMFSIYGPWESPARLIPALSLGHLRNMTVDLAAPEIARDFVYVGDAVQACMLAATKPGINGKIFNICSGKQMTLADVVASANRVTKTPLSVRWGTIKGRSFDTSVWVGDPTQAKKHLGWKATTPFDAGFKKTIDWFKKHPSPL
jgi:nucleoside-diphosphate-sugar epimerase